MLYLAGYHSLFLVSLCTKERPYDEKLAKILYSHNKFLLMKSVEHTVQSELPLGFLGATQLPLKIIEGQRQKIYP